MIKMGDKIRLTQPEKANFDNLTGTGAAPTSATEHDTILENAAQAWEQDGQAAEMPAEAALLAALCRDAKVNKD